MKQEPRVAVMLYDGDCGFCAHWIEKWRARTGVLVRYEPFQRALKSYPQVTEGDCRRAVQFITPEGKVFSGAHAVLKMMSIAGKRIRLLRAYESMPAFGSICEWFYQRVAHNRFILSKLFHTRTCRVKDLLH